MNNLKVLHIINGEFYSGAERVQDLLALRLPEYGYVAYLACLKPGKFKSNCACSGDLVHDFPMRSRVDFAQIGRLVDFIKQNDIRLIHTHTPRAALIGLVLAMRAGLPRVHHLHSPTSRDTENKLRNVINAVTERLSVMGVKRFIAVSDSIGQWAASMGIPRGRITVVPNGVPAMPPVDRSGRAEPLTVGSVALFRPRKGLEVLIRAIRLARDKGANLNLRVVGGFETAEYEKAIKDLANQLELQEHIVWSGFQNNIPNELAQLDIFALPSLYGEGMPMVVLEALASGLPIAASDVEGIPQVLGRDGTAGLLARPGDAESLAAQLLHIAGMTNAERNKMGMAARSLHEKKYSDLAMAENVAKVYANVLEYK